LSINRPPSADDSDAEAAYWAVRMAETPVAPEECARFEAWLAADPQNMSRVEDILRSWEAVEHYAASGPIMELREEALAVARESAAGRHPEWPGWTWRAALAAASLLLMMMAGGLWMTLQPKEYRTGIGERRVVMLGDGSTLSLDAGSRVNVRYSNGERQLSLDEGRAKFVVAKDPLRPFSVRVGSKLIIATGTAFSVERLGDEVRIILYEGHLALVDDSGTHGQPIALRLGQGASVQPVMSPNQEVILPDRGAEVPTPNPVVAVERVKPIEAQRSLSWESGQLVFNDEPLDQVVARVNRYADRPLRIGDADARALRVSGVFLAGDTSALLQGLQAAYHVRIASEANAIAIFSGKRLRDRMRDSRSRA
jgi:transmembrane sensor